MPRKSADRDVPSDGIEAAEWAIREVMKNRKTTPTQQLQAASAMIKLQFLKSKLKEPADDEPGSFFKSAAE